MADQDRSRWTKLVADFESCDLTQREFATERGIPLSNLRYWIYRLRKESRPLVSQATERSDQVPERGAAPEGSLRGVDFSGGASSSTGATMTTRSAWRSQSRVQSLPG